MLLSTEYTQSGIAYWDGKLQLNWNSDKINDLRHRSIFVQDKNMQNSVLRTPPKAWSNKQTAVFVKLAAINYSHIQNL